MKAYVAVDIGASSGRLMLGQLEDGKLKLQEMHRFKNGFEFKNNHDRWNIDYLIDEIFKGLEKIKESGYTEVSLGIDTWAVDYVLVGKDGKKLQDPISYRDKRTSNSINELTTEVSKEYIYKKTGIQFLNFNTLYQLFEEDKELLKKTDKIMMIPDYIGYILTGKAVTEITNASTTQMLSLREGLFDKNLLEKVNVSSDQFAKLVDAGTVLGNLKEDWYSKYELPKVNVVTVATHDTASAVIGTPCEGQHWAYLSSGTWSLIGTELNIPENGAKAFKENYTNEVLKETRECALSILSEKTNPEVISKFGFLSSSETNKFENRNYKDIDNLPVILEDICAYIIGEVIRVIDAETHDIFLIRVKQTEKVSEESPMTYKYYRERLKGNSPKKAPTYQEEKVENQAANRYQCSVCGYIYDDSKEEVKFEDLPEDWTCPLCGVGKDKFVKL